MHSRRACWAVTCAWDFFGTGERGPVGDSAAWGAPVDQTKVLRTNQPCWTCFLLAHRLNSNFSFLSFLSFSSPPFPSPTPSPTSNLPHRLIWDGLPFAADQEPAAPSIPPFQLHRNSCPSASGYTSVPAAFSGPRPACMNRHRWEPLSTLEILPRSG